MRVIEYWGDIIRAESDLICHQVTPLGLMTVGVSKQMKDVYPEVYRQYSDYCYENNYSSDTLGEVLFVELKDGRVITNLFSQQGNNKGKADNAVYTNYRALKSCLAKVREFMIENKKVSIAFPMGMGCGNKGGGDWSVVQEIITRAFEDTLIDVHIIKFDPKGLKGGGI